VKTDNPSACVTMNSKLSISAIACKYEMVVQCVNKSNHPIQNPLLLVTKPRTSDSMSFVGKRVRN
jgi:hypothetical protein